MKKLIEKRIKSTLAAVFNLPVVNIDSNASTHTIKEWDSLRHINLVIALEEEFNVRFEDPEIETLISYDIIVATLRGYVETERN